MERVQVWLHVCKQFEQFTKEQISVALLRTAAQRQHEHCGCDVQARWYYTTHLWPHQLCAALIINYYMKHDGLRYMMARWVKFGTM